MLLSVVSLGRIIENCKLVKREAGVPLIAVVKDDAYGHGAEEVSLALERYVSAFAVVSPQEGAALRVAGVSKEIMVLAPCLSEEEALSCFALSMTPSVSSLSSLALLLRAAERFGFSPRAQLVINTGMNRLGFRPGLAGTVCRRAKESGLEITGIFSHFYAPADVSARERQYRLFVAASEEAKGIFPNAIRHLSATGGILAGEKYRFDAVRSGIALYGYLPEGFVNSLGVRPAMKLYAQAEQSGVFLGGGVGYAAAKRRYGKLHTLRFGYGDGLFAPEGLGGVGFCMDAAIFEGDCRFGKEKLVLRDFGAYARASGRSVYEALVSAGRRSEKRYVR